MQIAYLNFDRGIPVLGDKGGSVHVRAVVGALARLGHEVTLLCSRAGEGNPPPPARLVVLEPEIGRADLEAECHRLGFAASALEDKLLHREISVLAHDRALSERALAALAGCGVRPDLIYERHALFHRAGVALARAFEAPRILEVNAPLAEEQERFRGLALRDLAIRRERQSWQEASLAVAVSEDMRAHLLAAGVPDRRILVSPNGVDTALFHEDGAAGGEVRRRWQLDEAPVIGFVGSFKAWHGVEFLIDAFARLHREQPRLRLLAVGEGPLLVSAKARVAAAELGEAVVFTGAVPHAAIPAHLAAMDLTVAPYPAQEGFYFSPLKVVESLAAGRAVVAPRIGQIETLVEDSVTGLLYPAGDLDACVAAITRLLKVPGLCGRLGAQAAARARAEWDWTVLVGRILVQAGRQPAAMQET